MTDGCGGRPTEGRYLPRLASSAQAFATCGLPAACSGVPGPFRSQFVWFSHGIGGDLRHQLFELAEVSRATFRSLAHIFILVGDCVRRIESHSDIDHRVAQTSISITTNSTKDVTGVNRLHGSQCSVAKNARAVRSRPSAINSFARQNSKRPQALRGISIVTSGE